MRLALALLLSVSTLACKSTQQGEAPSAATGDAGATLTIDRSSYSPGATVIMRITSKVSDTLGFNACSSRSIERQQGENWAAYPEPGRMCTMELRLLYANQTTTANTLLPRDLPTGTYRLVLVLGRQRSAPAGAPANWGTVRAVSSSFRVE